MKKVIFPCEHSSWHIVKEQLLLLRELSFQDGCDLERLAELHHMAYDVMHASGDYVENSSGNSIMYGLMRFLSKHASMEERELFLKSTFPGVIDLALKIKDLIQPDGVDCSIQQQEKSIVLNRQQIASILACGFLCLFPDKDRGRGQKLDTVNFTQFLTLLSSQSQIAKLRCILNYFERVLQQWNNLTGNVIYTRQVIPLEELPTLDTWLNCNFDLCHLEVHQDGLIEDAGCEAMEVDFANRYIGGGVLRNGRVQEEIRFSVCPELIVSRLFMEYMEENEAIVIEGYEQFSKTGGYATSLYYMGDFKDPATMDANGNLLNKMCAIDAISYRHGNSYKQYTDQHILRDLNKAFAGFCTGFNRPMDDGDANKESGSFSDEDYHTASESLEEDNGDDEFRRINAMAEELLARAITLAIPEALDLLLNFPRNVASINISIACDTRNEKSSVMVEDFASLDEECYNDGKEHLEVNFREWLSRRRRSSNLSDLSSRRSSYDVASRRSSCSTRYSSEFSSEFEEMYENFQMYDQKYKYHTIKEELGGSVVNEFASNLALQLLDEVTAEIGESDFCVLDFHNVQPAVGTSRPLPLKQYDSAVKETSNCVPLSIAEKYVDDLFNGIWPFPVGKDQKLSTQCQQEIRHILSQYCNKNKKLSPPVPGFPETVSYLSEDKQNHVSAFSITNENHTEGSKMPSEESLLLDAANNFVYQVIQEAMNEYEQMCRKKDLPRLTDLQYLSSVSSTIDCAPQQMNVEMPSMHSSFFRDETEIDFSDSKDESLHSINKTESAAYLTIAEKLVTDAFSSVAGCTCKRYENDSENRSENYSSHVCDVSLKTSDHSETKTEHHFDQNEIYSKVADSVLQNCLSDVSDMNKENDSNSINVCSVQHRSSFHQDQLSVELSSSDTGTSSDQSQSSQKGSSSDPSYSSGRIAIRSPRRNCPGSKLSKSSIEHSGSSSRSDKSVSPQIYSDMSKETSSPVPSSLKVKQSNSEVSSNVKNAVQKKIQFDVDVKDEPKTKDSWATGGHKYLDQYFNVLSRDLVTNAFLEVQGESVHASNYPRRSSEPIHLSNGAVQRRLAEHACDMSGSQISLVQCRTDEDLGRFAAELARYRSSADNGKEHRRRSTGFRDPVLSRFAEELMKVNVKAPSFLHIDSTNRSTSGSSQSGTSNISGFRDPLLASFEEELVNTSCVRSSAKNQNSSSRQKVSGHVSQQKGLSVESGNSLLGERVLKSMSFESHASGLSVASESGSCCSETVSNFAKDLASRILMQSLIVFHGMEDSDLRQEDSTVVIFSLESYSNNLARQIITTAVHEFSVVNCKSEFSKSNVIESPDQQDPFDHGGTDTGIEKTDETEKETRATLRSTSLSHDFEDALDVPYPVLEQYANCVADQVLVNAVKVWKREEECRLRRMCGRPIATGNWGCGAFGGDPHLKSLIQWMAASYAGTPVLMYYTFNNPQMIRLQSVVDIIKEKNWTVGRLMQAVRRYCLDAQGQMQQQGFIADNLFDSLIFSGTAR
ncbi:hypothetical protein ACJMK2_018213 [Sinanodonta woodiana]|uniref:poly(ADP-ribose) glycohydrolase n=1 Tax=Sinanodonta woodiana TaxID=1069815 RepID=A0ABD3UCR0_SINWO